MPARSAALLAAPDRSTWTGRRDHVLLLLALQTGLRRRTRRLALQGCRLRHGAISAALERTKGRSTPLRRDTAKLIELWVGDRRDADSPLLPSIRGERLSRDALEHLVRKHCLTASRTCPSIAGKRA